MENPSVLCSSMNPKISEPHADEDFGKSFETDNHAIKGEPANNDTVKGEPVNNEVAKEDFEEGTMLTAQNMDLLQAEAMERVERDGTEMLRNVFESMAVNGKITMDQLPFVLVGAEVSASAKEIDEAIEEHIPDADDAEALLDFDQVEALYQQLVHNAADLLPVEGAVEVQVQKKPAWWRRIWRWYELWQQKRKIQNTAYEKHMKPTTRLLLLILCTSSIISFAVVIFAVIFIWDHSMNTVAAHVVRDAELVKDGLQLFGYTHPFENYAQNLKRLATLLGVVIEELGYVANMRTLKGNLVYEQLLLSRLLDGWFQHDSITTVGTTVTLTKSWVQGLLTTLSVDELVDVVNSINPRLPEGHEILLARANGDGIDFLTNFKFASQCLNGVCGSGGSTATHKALHGETGALFGQDYRPMPVVAGYTYLSSVQLALIYNVKLSTFRKEFVDPVSAVVDEVNQMSATANATATTATTATSNQRHNSQEIVLGHQLYGPMEVVTALSLCDSKCMQAADISSSPVAYGVRGSNGVNETTDFNGEGIVAAYGPLSSAGLGMEVKIAKEEILDSLFEELGNALDVVNRNMQGTMEVQLAGQKKQHNASADDLEFYTAFRFAEECEGTCGTAPGTSLFLHNAIDYDETGVMQAVDYRGENVTAGYAALPLLNGAVAIKVDHQQILKEGVAMAGIIATYQNEVRYSGSSTEVMVGQKKPGVAVAKSGRDFNRVTVLKHRNQCPNMTCVGEAYFMVEAVNGKTGFAQAMDYRNKLCLGANIYLESLDAGVVVKIDLEEAQKNSVQLACTLAGCAISAVIISMVLLAVLANVLLKSMDRAWDEGKKAVEREKQAFRGVIEAMYPVQVAKRLLAGETQIVYNVPAAAVFFSDIYEFTTTSNAVTPEELIQFMGYTFGCMDHFAGHFGVYKVKTIGDAYLAVAGLPGSESPNGSPTLDMMLFASCCVQVFSGRYLHPQEAAILDEVVQNLIGKRKLGKKGKTEMPITETPGRPGGITYANPREDALAAALLPPENADEASKVHCIMRYGVAYGPITAGVLQGKTPLFDIWGKTVNLASRMESTGQPGRIQVSEGVYQTIIALKGQPFTFHARHKVFCKGFGNVSAYFVNTTSIAAPRDLLAAIHIEPNLGHFYFDNPVPGFHLAGKTSSGQVSSHHGSTSDQQSSKSSVVSGNNVRGGSELRH